MTAAVATEARRYHVGLTKACPLTEVTAGGFRLHRTTETVSIDHRGDTVRAPRPGQVATLTDEQHARLLEAIGRLAIRARRDNAGNAVEHWLVRVGVKRELVAHDVTPGEGGVRKTTPVYEDRQQTTFDPKIDAALAPFVFVTAVEADPFAAPVGATLPAPSWAKAFEDKKADVQVVKTGETNTPEPKRRATRSGE